MAGYTYASYTTYIPPFIGDPDMWIRHIHNDTGGVIDDPDNGIVPRIHNDETFQPSETVTIQTSPDSTATLSYEGTYELEGVMYPVFEDALGTLYFFSSEPDPLPAQLDITLLADNNAFSFASCFLAGTQIATPQGLRRIESLAIGDLVLTQDGRSLPVQFLGWQSIPTMFALDDRLPVLIERGALGRGMPERRLVVSADHALAMGDVLVNAGTLVNGGTIRVATRAEIGDQITYYNIETDTHDVILAEGTPAETFVDYRGRSAFDNYATYQKLYGQDRVIEEMDRPRIARRSMVPPALLAEIDRPRKPASRAA